MSLLTELYHIISGLGSYLLLPVFFFVLVLFSRRDWRYAGQCALTVLGCTVGMNLLISRLGSELVTLTNAMLEQYSLGAAAQNLHFSAAGPILFSSHIVYYMLPTYILANILLVACKATRVVNLDLWSFWQVALIGTLVEHLTGQFWYGMVAALLLGILQLLLADVFAPQVTTLTGCDNTTFTHSFALGFVPAAWGFNRLVDLIPSLRGKAFRLDRRREGSGFLMEPTLWGLILGFVLAMASGCDIYDSVSFALILAGCLFALPRLLRVLARALSSATEPFAVRAAHYNLPPLRFSVSALIGIANPTVILVAVIMTPVSVLLGCVLPGNIVLPQGDIAMLLYAMIFVVAISRGCFIRSLVSGALSVAAMLYCGTALTQLFSQTAAAADPAAYGSGLFNILCNGANPLALLTVEGASFSVAGLAALGVITLACIFLNAHRIRRMGEKAAVAEKH